MNEFSLIDTYFKALPKLRSDVVLGIGDDAACMQVPPGHNLLVSTDTLVAGVHFLSDWKPYAIAYRAVMVNISDIVAMGGEPAWLTLALTLPAVATDWLEDFSQGINDALRNYNLALVGGDTTRGPLTITITIHGFIPEGKEIRRSGAQVGDSIYLTGPIGGAALAVSLLQNTQAWENSPEITEKLLAPTPRTDWINLLRKYATAAIDISDGLAADLNHILKASKVGGWLDFDKIPVHPLLKEYQAHPTQFAVQGGDDYEICFTVPDKDKNALLEEAQSLGLQCFFIGEIQANQELQAKIKGRVETILPLGYQHF